MSRSIDEVFKILQCILLGINVYDREALEMLGNLPIASSGRGCLHALVKMQYYVQMPVFNGIFGHDDHFKRQ